ncbi:hypothetical protein ACJQWK_11692 [Exserohilum turcicum]
MRWVKNMRKEDTDTQAMRREETTRHLNRHGIAHPYFITNLSTKSGFQVLPHQHMHQHHHRPHDSAIQTNQVPGITQLALQIYIYIYICFFNIFVPQKLY